MPSSYTKEFASAHSRERKKERERAKKAANMAATASASPWGKPGAWALAAEQEEDQAAAPEEAADFPSLAAAAKPTKKKKAQTLSLAEFTTGKAVTYGAAKPGGNVVLPTGPRERSAEELERARFGGGSRSYGGGGGGEESRWGSGRGFGDEPRRGGGVERDLGPSRADEADDWGAGKRTAAPPPPPRGRMFESHSRADDSGSWVANKGLAPSPPPPESRARRGGIDAFVGAGDSAESWGRKKEEAVGGGRRRLVLQPRTAPLGNGEGSSNSNTKAKGANPFGEARPREEVLAEKGHDWKKIDEELESLKIKETGCPSDGFGVGRKGFARAGLAEERTERSWRKPEVVEDAPRFDLSLNCSFSSFFFFISVFSC